MSKVDYGTVEVEVGGETYVLSPTLDCIRKMKRWGLASPMAAIEACRGFDPETLAIVIASASGKGQKDLSQIAEAVHNQGTVVVTPKVMDFLVSLLNPTGKEVWDSSGGESEGE